MRVKAVRRLNTKRNWLKTQLVAVVEKKMGNESLTIAQRHGLHFDFDLTSGEVARVAHLPSEAELMLLFWPAEKDLAGRQGSPVEVGVELSAGEAEGAG